MISLSLSHILPLSHSFLSLRIAFSSLPYSSFYFLPTLHAFPHSILSPFFLKSPLSSVQLLPSHPPSFSAPVEYCRMFFSPLPQLFHRSLLFLPKICSWYPSFIPPFSFPAVFFPSLHTHASSSDFHFTVIYGNPFSSSQRQSLSLPLPLPPPRSSSTPRLISPPLD